MKTIAEWAAFYDNNLIKVVPNASKLGIILPFEEYDWENCSKLKGYLTGMYGIMLLSLDFKDREEPFVFKVVTFVLSHLEIYNYPFVIQSGTTVSFLVRGGYGGVDNQKIGRITVLRKGDFDLPCYTNLVNGSNETTFYFKGIPQCYLAYVKYETMEDCIQKLIEVFGIGLDKYNMGQL